MAEKRGRKPASYYQERGLAVPSYGRKPKELQPPVPLQPDDQTRLALLRNADSPVADQTRFYMELNRMKKVNLFKPDEIRKRSKRYFQMCADFYVKPTVAGLALSLGYKRQIVMSLANGTESDYYINAICKGRRVSDQTREALADALMVINAFIEEDVASNRMNSVGAIFLLKNNFEYEDSSKVEIRPVVESQKTADDLIIEAEALGEEAQN